MKKLMFLAVVAAASVASAAVCVTTKDECGDETSGAGSAYKVQISLKTTGVKSKSLKVQCEDATCTYWRQQTTKKINGLLWKQSDDCAGCDWLNDEYYSAFWTKDAAVPAEFAIGVGMIGAGSAVKSDGEVVGYAPKGVEAYGAMTGDDFGELAFGAFGSLYGATKKNMCEDDDCVMFVKNLTGGIAGKLVAPEFVGKCDDTCDPIMYAGCCDDIQLEYTAAYGTIKIAFDNSISKKVAVAEDDTAVATFVKLPTAVASDIEDYVSSVTLED